MDKLRYTVNGGFRAKAETLMSSLSKLSSFFGPGRILLEKVRQIYGSKDASFGRRSMYSWNQVDPLGKYLCSFLGFSLFLSILFLQSLKKPKALFWPFTHYLEISAHYNTYSPRIQCKGAQPCTKLIRDH